MQADQTLQADLVRRLGQAEGYLTSDPGNTDLLSAAIDLSLATGDIARAERHIDAALGCYPGDPYFVYRRGHVLVAQGRWNEAQALFAELLAANPDVNIAYSLAQCQVQALAHQDALETLAPYRDSAALAPEAVTLLVRALHHVGDLRAADALVGEWRERLAAEPAFLAAAGLMYFDDGQLELARELSDASLALGARPLEALVVGATLALGATDTEQAIAGFNEVLALNPHEGRSWSGLGMASLLRRDLDGAAFQLGQAVKFMPQHIGSWQALGWCRLFALDMPGAEAAFQSALGLDHNFGESHGALAVAAALRGERDVAEAAIARAMRLDPQCLSARYAQLVLSGQTADHARFKAIAYRLMASRKTITGDSMVAVIKRHAGE